MENSKIFQAIIILAVGIFIGWLIWGNVGMGRMYRLGMHKMPDGSMMNNNGMDMQDMMDEMMTGLSGKTGDEFDKAFIEEMIVHHEGAVAMAQAAQKDAKHAEIKTMANAIISAQTREIEQMKTWMKNWYGEN